MRQHRVSSALCGVLAFVATLVSFASVSAQESVVEQAIQRYEEARERMQEQRFAEACELFEESQRLDPQLGTLLHLADCQERDGKLARAYDNYVAASSLAAERARLGKPDARGAVAERRAERLRMQLTAASVSVKSHEHVSAIPIEPSQPMAAKATPTATNYQNIIGYSVGGLGVVGLGVATYLGLRSLHFASQRDELCPSGTCALQATDVARMEHAERAADDFAAAFNWTGAFSLIALGVGTTLVLTAPRERELALALGWGTVQLSGTLQ